jgi:hypothetical protein
MEKEELLKQISGAEERLIDNYVSLEIERAKIVDIIISESVKFAQKSIEATVIRYSDTTTKLGAEKIKEIKERSNGYLQQMKGIIEKVVSRNGIFSFKAYTGKFTYKPEELKIRNDFVDDASTIMYNVYRTIEEDIRKYGYSGLILSDWFFDNYTRRCNVAEKLLLSNEVKTYIELINKIIRIERDLEDYRRKIKDIEAADLWNNA